MGTCLQRARETLHIVPPSKPQLVAIAVLMGACVVLGLIAFSGFGGHEVVVERGLASTDSVAEPAASDDEAVPQAESDSDVTAQTYICVYVTGAVQAPAVYELPEGARVTDAIAAAGGATFQANLAAINLAKQVSDAEMIYVPGYDDENVTNTTISKSVSESNSVININTASADELKTLNGIGDVLAQAIVDERETNGPYSSVDDLVRVSGIGAKTLARFSDKVCA